MHTAEGRETGTEVLFFIPDKRENMPKRLLLTGGAGFIGHHLVEGVLKELDWEVVVLDGLTYSGNLNRITDIREYEANKHRVKFVPHHLMFPISETTHKIIGEIDYVWHLAAESHVQNSLEDAIPFAYNVVSTTNLLEYLRKYQPNLEKYIGFNTDEVFGPAPQGIYHTEDYKFKPSNPYSASKGGQWCMEYAFWKSHQMPIIMVHSMNIYGERQHPEKFIPMVIRRLLNGEKITLHGVKGGKISSRCWIHAREIFNGLLYLTERGKVGETYNIVGEEETVVQIANRISKVINNRDLLPGEIEWVDYHSTRPGHDLRYALDGTKIKKIGWQPRFTLDESMGRMVRWMIQPENRRWLIL